MLAASGSASAWRSASSETAPVGGAAGAWPQATARTSAHHPQRGFTHPSLAAEKRGGVVRDFARRQRRRAQFPAVPASGRPLLFDDFALAVGLLGSGEGWAIAFCSRAVA